jgi:hypothetical protein
MFSLPITERHNSTRWPETGQFDQSSIEVGPDKSCVAALSERNKTAVFDACDIIHRHEVGNAKKEDGVFDDGSKF